MVLISLTKYISTRIETNDAKFDKTSDCTNFQNFAADTQNAAMTVE